ncbi:sll1863 family stress response protein [Gimesia fumaroli]|uniref:Uncharacterized protein n=1 Tax=Gimesia fumaroli TaxID=2527976 RepID=A0A518I6Z9_9PLAN|nr:hypothetical protein [Gimesia fumaroli]QDV48864.1 hypothetical protein Enr17x_08780 [Gimesia fumaroli]
MRNLTPCLLSLSLLLVACENQSPSDSAPVEKKVTGDDVKKEVGEAIDTAKDFTAQKKDEYAKQINKKLADLNVKIEEMQAKGAKLKDDAKAKWDEKMKDLEAKRAELNEKLEQVKDSSADAWAGLKKDIESAWDNLKKSFDDAEEQISESV